MKGTLYVVATPLGNLQDITLRALQVLKEVSVIAAEDTRHSGKLLAHYGIATRVVSYFDACEQEKAPRLVERMKRGESVALISDAGTPGIADPGYRLVRAAIEAGVRVVPVPGPSVFAAVLSAAGLPTDRFAFEGFVPARTAARRAFYARLRSEPRTVVCLEVGRRLEASLEDLLAVLGDRDIVIAREVTKIFEEFLRGTASRLRAAVEGRPVRGEITLVIAAASGPAAVASDDEVRRAVARLRGTGLRLKDVARAVAMETGRPPGDVYRIAVEDKQ